MFWGRFAQAARQRWHQHGTRAGRFAPGLIAGGLALLALLVLTRWSWRNGHEVVAQAEAPAQVVATAAVTHTATATPTATPTATITATGTPLILAALIPTPTATALPSTAAQSPLPTPDILALLSASLGGPITISVPAPTQEIVPHVLPVPTLTPTLAVSATGNVTESVTADVTGPTAPLTATVAATVTATVTATAAATSTLPITPALTITDVLTRPIANMPPGGMGALIAAARERNASGDLPPTETPAAEPVGEAGAAEATPLPALPPPAATAAIAPTPDGTVRTARVPILMYHYLSVPPAGANAFRLDLSVPPDRFAAHLDAMQQAGYTTISLYTWLAHLTQGAPLPDKPVVITFDDGYRDAYENAFPLLRSHGMTATFFIITDFIDEQRPEYLTWDMVREMYAAGMSIESHGRNHVSLANKDNDYLVWQALGSLETIQYELGVRPRFISYPAGDYDQATIDIFRSANYWGGFTTEQGATHSSDDLFRAKRVRVHGDTSPEQLLRLLALDW